MDFRFVLWLFMAFPPMVLADDNSQEVEKRREVGKTRGFGATQEGVIDGTDEAQDQGKKVNILGMAMGAAFARPCFKSPPDPFSCAAMAMSFKDAFMGSSAKGSASSAGAHFDSLYGGGYGGDEYGNQGPEREAAQKHMAQLKDMGYSLNGDGSVTLPDGRKVTSADLSSLDGLTNQGLSPEAAAQFLSQSRAIKAAAVQKAHGEIDQVAQEGADGGQTNFGQRGQASVSTPMDPSFGPETEEIEYRYRQKKKGQRNRMPASQAARLSKTFKGEPIGIGMANIFLIVHQKYQEKQKKKHEFLGRGY